VGQTDELKRNLKKTAKDLVKGVCVCVCVCVCVSCIVLMCV